MWGLFGFIIGAVLGSFIKVLADRGLNGRSFWGRSYCPHCKHMMQWYDLFPIFSFVFLHGKCRYCHKKIGMEYLLVEVVVGFLIGFLFWQSFDSVFSLQSSVFSYKFAILILDLIFNVFFISILVALFLTDLKKMILPDRITLPAILIGIIFITVIMIIKIIFLYYYLSQSAIGRLLLPPRSDYFQRHALIAAHDLLGGMAMGFILGGFFLSLIIITKGKGMGGGDVKLGTFIGIMLGFPQALLAVVLAFLSGAIFSVGLIFAGKKHFGQVVPFGPFLVLGSLTTLFWGNQILDWYLKLQF